MEENPTAARKSIGCVCERITSTALEFPTFGPVAGGLLTVTVTGLELVGVPVPLVYPFCAAADCAAAVELPPAPMNSASDPARAAASAADCMASFALHT